MQSEFHLRRELAMTWWNSKLDEEKQELCSNSALLIGGPRIHNTLTGREIQMLFEENHKVTDIVRDLHPTLTKFDIINKIVGISEEISILQKILMIKVKEINQLNKELKK